MFNGHLGSDAEFSWNNSVIFVTLRLISSLVLQTKGEAHQQGILLIVGAKSELGLARVSTTHYFTALTFYFLIPSSSQATAQLVLGSPKAHLLRQKMSNASNVSTVRDGPERMVDGRLPVFHHQ